MGIILVPAESHEPDMWEAAEGEKFDVLNVYGNGTFETLEGAVGKAAMKEIGWDRTSLKIRISYFF